MFPDIDRGYKLAYENCFTHIIYQILSIDFCVNVSDLGIRNLSQLRCLEELDLEQQKITDDTLLEIAKRGKLKVTINKSPFCDLFKHVCLGVAIEWVFRDQ